jgi:hypothetical protein
MWRILVLIFAIVLGAMVVYRNWILLTIVKKIGGAIKFLDKHYVLIVDVANMHTTWKLEKFGVSGPLTQYHMFKEYISCMTDHYDVFRSLPANKDAMVYYVVKNHKKLKGEVVNADIIPDNIWLLLCNFVMSRDKAKIAVAEDYKIYPVNVWKDVKKHYLRGCDDFLCFYLAQLCNRRYKTAYIMSNDKYKDYDNFGLVPPFLCTVLSPENGTILLSESMCHKKNMDIRPRPNMLGQIKDYNLVPITLDFAFGDERFLKTSDYKIPQSGQVWS